jgi:putative adhesin
MEPRLPNRARRLGLFATAWLTLCVVGASACGFDLLAQAEARDEWRRSYKIARGGTFEIRNTNGKIRLQPGEGDTIEVVATRVVRAPTEEQAKKTLSEFQIEEKVASDSIVVDGTTRGLSVNRSRHVDFAVRLPKWVNVTLKATNGEIDADGLTGMFRAETTNGTVKAGGLEDGAVVETTNGTVQLDFAKLGESGVRCSTTNGRVTVTLPRDVKARLQAEVTNGGISTSGLEVATTHQSRRKFEGTVGGGGPSVRVETTNGDIEFRGR